MTDVVNEFAQQTNRLRRRRWSRLDMLADEVETLFVTEAEPTTGPIVADLRSNAGENVQFTAKPLQSLFFPRLDVDASFGFDVVPQASRSAKRTKIGTRETISSLDYRFRTTCPGRIVSQEPDETFTVDLYPDGTNRAPIRVANVTHLNDDVVIQPNTWAPMVVRLSTLRVSEIEERPGFAGPLLSKRTHVQLLNRRHYFAITKPWVPQTGVDLGRLNPIPVTTTAPWGLGPRAELPPAANVSVYVDVGTFWPFVSGSPGSESIQYGGQSAGWTFSWPPQTTLIIPGSSFSIPPLPSNYTVGQSPTVDSIQLTSGGYQSTINGQVNGLRNAGGASVFGSGSQATSIWLVGGIGTGNSVFAQCTYTPEPLTFTVNGQQQQAFWGVNFTIFYNGRQ